MSLGIHVSNRFDIYISIRCMSLPIAWQDDWMLSTSNLQTGVVKGILSSRSKVLHCQKNHAGKGDFESLFKILRVQLANRMPKKWSRIVFVEACSKRYVKGDLIPYTM